MGSSGMSVCAAPRAELAPPTLILRGGSILATLLETTGATMGPPTRGLV